MSDEQDDLLVFFDDQPGASPEAQALSPAEMLPVGPELAPWRILVVDDDADVHIMTRLVLGHLHFRGRGVELLGAYSGTEAAALMRRESNVALAFIDVVMESEHAGLKLIHCIRDELHNHATRLILRTGQPGQAPEPQVVIDYDINDYKMKTELTHQKLFSCTVAALRGYEHLITLEESRRGLRRIIDVTSRLSAHRTLTLFATGVLKELVVMTGAGPGALLCYGVLRSDSLSSCDEIRVLATTDSEPEPTSARQLERSAPILPNGPQADAIREALRKGRGSQGRDHQTLYFQTPNQRESVVFLPGAPPIPADQRLLIDIFLDKIAVGIDTLELWQHLATAHKATVIALADMAEGRDTDTGEHVLRVASLSERIARRLRTNGHYRDLIDDIFLEQIGTASMLHDVGKVSIPDRILLKPGRLDPEERAVMETHAAAGGQMLAKAAAMVDDNSYLRLGQQIALYHHEWFDGTGYPHQKARTDIPLAARIVALADVFDALSSTRPYKRPWPSVEVLSHIRSLSGRQFDPLVVAALLDELPEGFQSNEAIPAQP